MTLFQESFYFRKIPGVLQSELSEVRQQEAFNLSGSYVYDARGKVRYDFESAV